MHHKTKLLNLAFEVLATLSAFLPAYAQSPQERHARLKSALESGDVKTSLTELTSLRSLNPEFLPANNYD